MRDSRVNISPHLRQFHKMNFPPVISKLKNDLLDWKNLHLAWLGHIAVVKTNGLPEINFLCQGQPVWTPKTALEEIQAVVAAFIQILMDPQGEYCL